MKRLAEFLPEQLGARVTVRLEERDHPFAARGAGGGECGADFARVVRVVVHYDAALALVFDLETPFRPAERLERGGDPLESDAERVRERDDAQSVRDVMFAGHVEHDGAERTATAQHVELRLEILHHEVRIAESGAFASAEG